MDYEQLPFLIPSLRSQNEMFGPLSKCVPVSYSLPAVATCVSLTVRVAPPLNSGGEAEI
jgi:hypothetical protein